MDRPIATTEPVIMEVTAGARTPEREADLRHLLLSFDLLRFDANVDFVAATAIYRTCRRRGITPRGFIDCMIAAVAARHRATLLALDTDMTLITAVMGIAVDGASR